MHVGMVRCRISLGPITLRSWSVWKLGTGTPCMHAWRPESGCGDRSERIGQQARATGAYRPLASNRAPTAVDAARSYITLCLEYCWIPRPTSPIRRAFERVFVLFLHWEVRVCLERARGCSWRDSAWTARGCGTAPARSSRSTATTPPRSSRRPMAAPDGLCGPCPWPTTSRPAPPSQSSGTYVIKTKLLSCSLGWGLRISNQMRRSISGKKLHLACSLMIHFVRNFECRVMLVGWGGNNGTTLTAGVIANRE